MKINNLRYCLFILGCSVSFAGAGHAEDCAEVTVRGMGTLSYQPCDPKESPVPGFLDPLIDTRFKVKKDTPISITLTDRGHEYPIYQGVAKPGLKLHCIGLSCKVVN